MLGGGLDCYRQVRSDLTREELDGFLRHFQRVPPIRFVLGRGFSSVWHAVLTAFGGSKGSRLDMTSLNEWAFGKSPSESDESREWQSLMSHKRNQE